MLGRREAQDGGGSLARKEKPFPLALWKRNFNLSTGCKAGPGPGPRLSCARCGRRSSLSLFKGISGPVQLLGAVLPGGEGSMGRREAAVSCPCCWLACPKEGQGSSHPPSTELATFFLVWLTFPELSGLGGLWPTEPPSPGGEGVLGLQRPSVWWRLCHLPRKQEICARTAGSCSLAWVPS